MQLRVGTEGFPGRRTFRVETETVPSKQKELAILIPGQPWRLESTRDVLQFSQGVIQAWIAVRRIADGF